MIHEVQVMNEKAKKKRRRLGYRHIDRMHQRDHRTLATRAQPLR